LIKFPVVRHGSHVTENETSAVAQAFVSDNVIRDNGKIILDFVI
jgi:hypothetical protein